ncbi:MAG: ATP phosphoribosyltransferase [Planctomycetota bacterium]
MTNTLAPSTIHFAVPKGRMFSGIERLLADAGLPLRTTARDYRPSLPLEGFETKILKPRAIVEMLDAGTRDVGFAGADWVADTGVELVELLDTRLDRVRLVAAAPEASLDGDKLRPDPSRELVVASEYANLTSAWIETLGVPARLLRSYGATEVLPPEDADCIVDNTATGSTLRANGLRIFHELMTSSTRLYASRAAMDDPSKRARLEELAMLVRSVLDARERVLLEVNCGEPELAAVVDALPCMRRPTVARLHDDAGYSVRAAVRRADLPAVIPAVKAAGGSDILVSSPGQIVR